MKILVTYALEEERGSIQLPDCLLTFCCTGVGKVSTAIATYEAVLRERPDLVLNLGTAGTLTLPVGTILVCNRFLDRDLEKVSALGLPFQIGFEDLLREAGFLKAAEAIGVVSTGDTFLTDLEQTGVHADVFDMEAYATAQVCRKLELPFLSVKYVTDVIGQNSIKHWEDKLLEAKHGLADYLQRLQF